MMLAQERRNLVLEQLQEEKSVVVATLSQTFGVSEETIRRDLDKLEKDGFALKSYGGAVLNEDLSIDLPFNVRKKHNTTGKQQMAELVKTLIDSGDHIMLDASTTAVFIAKTIKDQKNMTVITNSLEVMVELSDKPDWKLISPGGQLRAGYLALVGSRVVEGVSEYRVEKTIISCKGIDLAHGITDGNEDFAQVKLAMLRSAKERILVVDHTKFDHVGFVRIDDIEYIDVVVTDKKPSLQWLEYFDQHHIRCLYPVE